MSSYEEECEKMSKAEALLREYKEVEKTKDMKKMIINEHLVINCSKQETLELYKRKYKIE